MFVGDASTDIEVAAVGDGEKSGGSIVAWSGNTACDDRVTDGVRDEDACGGDASHESISISEFPRKVPTTGINKYQDLALSSPVV